MIHDNEFPVMQALEELHISFDRFEHGAAMTMDDCDLFDAGLPAAHCKNLFLTNRQGTDFYLLLVAGEKPFKTKDLSAQLGISRLSFASAAQLMEVLGLTPGSVSPMGLLNDTQRRVHVLLDREISRWENIIVHPNINTASLMLRTLDLFHFLHARGNQVTEVDVLASEA